MKNDGYGGGDDDDDGGGGVVVVVIEVQEKVVAKVQRWSSLEGWGTDTLVHNIIRTNNAPACALREALPLASGPAPQTTQAPWVRAHHHKHTHARQFGGWQRERALRVRKGALTTARERQDVFEVASR